MSVPSPSRRIAILREEVARRIAAGEVIDRPLSVVRELLDNALDSGARSIDVHLEAGGIGGVRVVDDGAGMDAEDLALCWQPHATSKIQSEDDLLRISSLGFRGEALSSMAVASRLEVVSAAADGAAHRLVVRAGRQEVLEPCQGRRGTVVSVSELFFNLPARRRFLRSASVEAGMCRSVFLDRAIAHPEVAFRLFADGTIRLTLPPTDAVSRVAVCHGLDPGALGPAEARAAGLAVRLVAALPEERRRDRRLLQCFVNRRRVQEFALLQAAEYGFQGYIPGGYHPVAFVFVEIDPSLVDVNIHPAKKEIRFRNLPDVRRAIAEAVRSFLQGRSASWAAARREGGPAAEPLAGWQPAVLQRRTAGPREPVAGRPAAYPLPERPPVAEPPSPGEPRFIGQAFGVFLIFELPDRLVYLDQHAAHERILYEELAARLPEMQELLFPISFDVSADEDGRLATRSSELAEAGIAVVRVGSGTWEVTALDGRLRPLAEDAIVESVRQACGAEREWREGVLRAAACRLAIKEGDAVDGVTARELWRQARSLAEPRCPHGRPLWHEEPRSRLFDLVDRPRG